MRPAVPLLSVVVPALNEAKRLPSFLTGVHEYLFREFENRHEVIVVDDGSKDRLGETLDVMFPSWRQLRVIRHERNMGKGGAVRTGVLASTGQLVLFTDADGAAPIGEERALRAALQRGADVAIGSRYVASPKSRRRALHRWASGRIFSALVKSWFSLPVSDTQCGFKMYTRACAQQLYRRSKENGYTFDVEVLVLADKCGYRIAETAVDWHEMAGGKPSLLSDSYKMLLELRRLRDRLATLQLDDGTEAISAVADDAHSRPWVRTITIE